jgi:hypothetical protein
MPDIAVDDEHDLIWIVPRRQVLFCHCVLPDLFDHGHCRIGLKAGNRIRWILKNICRVACSLADYVWIVPGGGIPGQALECWSGSITRNARKLSLNHESFYARPC